MQITRNFILGIIAILAGIVIIFSLGLFDIFWMRTHGVEVENARHEIFEHSTAHIDGMKRDALKIYREYNQSKTEDEKNAVKATARLMFNDFDEELLESNELIEFIKFCKYK